MFNYAKFEKLCRERDTTAYRICAETGIASATISSWKIHYESNGKNGYIPKIEKVAKIAKFFKVPIEYFLEE